LPSVDPCLDTGWGILSHELSIYTATERSGLPWRGDDRSGFARNGRASAGTLEPTSPAGDAKFMKVINLLKVMTVRDGCV